jgi:hypothetical protein
VRIGAILPGPITEWRGTSWLLGGLVAGEQLRQLAVTLHVIAGMATLLCAAAIAFAPSFPGWWRPLGLFGAATGMLAFAVFWDGQTRLLAEEGVIGAGVSFVLLLAAMTIPRVAA